MPLPQIAPVGLITTEFVTNAAKHGASAITVSLRPHNASWRLDVTDNGDGLPEEFDTTKNAGLGMKVIASLIASIKGELTFRNNQNGAGATFTVIFPSG